MPTPPKTSQAVLLSEAQAIIEEEGIDALTMSSLARRAGIRGPSLYKHFSDREAVMIALETHLFEELRRRLSAIEEREPLAALRQMAVAFREFGRERPRSYSLLYTLRALDPAKAAEARWRALDPAMVHLVPAFGTEAFLRARALVSFLHGFVSMESAGAFRLGEDLEAAFESGLDLLLARRQTHSQ